MKAFSAGGSLLLHRAGLLLARQAVGFAGWVHLLFFGVLLPLGAWRSKRHLERGGGLPAKRAYFFSVLVNQWVFVAVSLIVARFEGIPLFSAPRPSPAAWGLAFGLFALQAVVGYLRVGARVRRRDPKLCLAMPTDAVERAQWAGIALSADVGEEITYRGVLVTVLHRLTGNFPPAAVIAAAIWSTGPVRQALRDRPSVVRAESRKGGKRDLRDLHQQYIFMHMRTTLNIDDSLLRSAARLTGIREKTALVHKGLEALIARESARRLAELGGTEKALRAPRRRRPGSAA